MQSAKQTNSMTSMRNTCPWFPWKGQVPGEGQMSGGTCPTFRLTILCSRSTGGAASRRRSTPFIEAYWFVASLSERQRTTTNRELSECMLSWQIHCYSALPRTYRAKWCHKIYGQDTIAVLWVYHSIMYGIKGRRFTLLCGYKLN